ncbi:MAG: hypothetical protein IPK93_03135 [Solirubrobacterales bacterium]|nr:hypothetical protein [Solirubrobacterales bacterium]
MEVSIGSGIATAADNPQKTTRIIPRMAGIANRRDAPMHDAASRPKPTTISQA